MVLVGDTFIPLDDLYGNGYYPSNLIIVDLNAAGNGVNNIYNDPLLAIAAAAEGDIIRFFPGTYTITDINENWAKKNVIYEFMEGSLVNLTVATSLFKYTQAGAFDNSNIIIRGKGKIRYTGPVMTAGTYVEFYPIYIKDSVGVSVDIELDIMDSPFGMFVKVQELKAADINIDHLIMKGFVAFNALTFSASSDDPEVKANININRLDMIAKAADGGLTAGYAGGVEIKELSNSLMSGNLFVDVNIGTLYAYDDSTGYGYQLLKFKYSDNIFGNNNSRIKMTVGNLIADIANNNQYSYAIRISDHFAGDIDLTIDNMHLEKWISPLSVVDDNLCSINSKIRIKKLRTNAHVAYLSMNYDTIIDLVVDDGLLYGTESEGTIWLTGDKTKSNNLSIRGYINNTTPESEGLYITQAIKKVDFINTTFMAEFANRITSSGGGIDPQIVKVLGTLAIDKPLSGDVVLANNGLIIKLYDGSFVIFAFDDPDLVGGVYTVQHNFNTLYPDLFMYDQNGNYVEPSGVLGVVDENNVTIDIGGTGGEWNAAAFNAVDEIVYDIRETDLVDGAFTINHSLPMAFPFVTIYNDSGEYQTLNGIYSVIDNNTIKLDFGSIGSDIMHARIYSFRVFFVETISNTHPGFSGGKLTIIHNRNTTTPIVGLFNGNNGYESLNGLLQIIDNNTIELAIDSSWIGGNDWTLLII
jgi:hypothetical protein